MSLVKPSHINRTILKNRVDTTVITPTHRVKYWSYPFNGHGTERNFLQTHFKCRHPMSAPRAVFFIGRTLGKTFYRNFPGISIALPTILSGERSNCAWSLPQHLHWAYSGSHEGAPFEFRPRYRQLPEKCLHHVTSPFQSLKPVFH